jgi:hypothetical protein
MYGIIYKATGPTGLVYIGQTRNSINIHISRHKRSAIKLGESWGRFPAALRSLEFDSFAWEQIDTAETPEELNEKEKHWIAFYQSTDPEHGYNASPGAGFAWNKGKRGIYTDEALQKMSQAKKGKPLSAEHCHSLSVARKGKSRPNCRGKHLSPEHRRKVREGMKNSSKIKSRRRDANGRFIPNTPV